MTPPKTSSRFCPMNFTTRTVPDHRNWKSKKPFNDIPTQKVVKWRRILKKFKLHTQFKLQMSRHVSTAVLVQQPTSRYTCSCYFHMNFESSTTCVNGYLEKSWMTVSVFLDMNLNTHLLKFFSWHVKDKENFEEILKKELEKM